jgi:hypothetical protein
MNQSALVLGVLADVSIAALLVYQIVAAVRDATTDKIIVAITSVIPGVAAMLLIPKLCRQMFEDPFLKLGAKYDILEATIARRTEILEEGIATKTQRLEEQLKTELNAVSENQTGHILAAFLEITKTHHSQPDSPKSGEEHTQRVLYELARNSMDKRICESAKGGCVKLLDTLSINRAVEERGKGIHTTVLNAYGDMHVLYIAVIMSADIEKEREAFRMLLNMGGWVLRGSERTALEGCKFAC